MSQCKGSCSCPMKRCNCARNSKPSKGINFKASGENKETITDDTKPKTTSVACEARKPTNFWDDVALFVELGNKIVNYAKEQQMKSGTASDGETTDTTYDSDFESGEDSGGSRKERCDLGEGGFEGGAYPPLNYNASSNLSRTPIPQWASTPKTIRGGISNVNCGIACCQCPTNTSTFGTFADSSIPNHPTFGGTYVAGARSPRGLLAQRTPELSVDVSVPNSYRQTRTGGTGGRTFNVGQTRTGGVGGATFNMGATRSGGAAGTTFNRGQRNGGVAGAGRATRSGGASRTFDMGRSRSGTCGSGCPNDTFNGAGGEIFDMDRTPPGFSGLGTCGSDIWGSPAGAYGGGSRFPSPGPFSPAANIDFDDYEEWVPATDIINEAGPPHCQDLSFDFADNALQEPDEWLQYESSMPHPAPPYRPHCMGGLRDEHDEMCEFASQSQTGQSDQTMSSFCRTPMYLSPAAHTSTPASATRSNNSPYFETCAARCSGRN